MAILIIFTLVGMVLGEIIFSPNGWLVGGVLGFLLTKIIQLASKVDNLEHSLKRLESLQVSHVETNAAAPTALKPISENNHAPLAERLKAHGIELPPEQPVGDFRQSLNSQVDDVMQYEPAISQPSAVVRPKRIPQPSPAEKAFAYAKRFFTEGNPIVRIGMVVMFFGLSFLVKYASNQGLLPLEIRMAAVAATAFVLIVLGWKTRARAGGYGLVLQGGGIAALYLTIFAAAKMYTLMPIGFAFALMFLIVLFGAALAVLQGAQVLALMASAGGFLVPVLTSDGSGNHIGLFSYYLLLNVGVLIIAWFKTWRLLNWIGFVFTFVITSAWGVLEYESNLYISTQPFLIAFFLLYLTVSILFSIKQPLNLKGLVDGSLVFGLPVVGFGLQAALLKHTEYGMAISATIMAAIYIFIARFLWEKYQSTHKVLIESFIALGVCFATLSIPLALNAQWTSASWALEATGLIWIGLRQSRLLSRIAGYCLYIAGALSLLVNGIDAGDVPIVTGDFIGLTILAVSAFCIAYLINRYEQNCRPSEKKMANIAQLIGWVWWVTAGFVDINSHINGVHHFASFIIFLAVSVAILLWIGEKTGWHLLSRIGYWLLPLAALVAVYNFGEGRELGYSVYPPQGRNLIALVSYLVIQYGFLRRIEQQAATGLLGIYHILSAWFLFFLCYWEASYWQSHFQWQGTSAAVLWFICLVFPLIILIFATTKSIWPFKQHLSDYKNLIPAPLLFFLLLWFFYASDYSGVTDQFYLPILNPLDIAQATVLFIFAYAIRRGFIGLGSTPAFFRFGILGALAFVWFNVVLLRSLHQYTDVAYTAYALWNSVLVQMSLSILWAICALVVMNISRRMQIRTLWIIGAVLLGLVLIKLFTKDLTGTGTLARIVSFMVVGGLMLLIGYLSPIPGKSAGESVEKNNS